MILIKTNFTFLVFIYTHAKMLSKASKLCNLKRNLSIILITSTYVHVQNRLTQITNSFSRKINTIWDFSSRDKTKKPPTFHTRSRFLYTSLLAFSRVTKCYVHWENKFIFHVSVTKKGENFSIVFVPSDEKLLSYLFWIIIFRQFCEL